MESVGRGMIPRVERGAPMNRDDARSRITPKETHGLMVPHKCDGEHCPPQDKEFKSSQLLFRHARHTCALHLCWAQGETNPTELFRKVGKSEFS